MSTLTIAGSSVGGSYVYQCEASVAVPDDVPVVAYATTGVVNFSLCKPHVCWKVLSMCLHNMDTTPCMCVHIVCVGVHVFARVSVWVCALCMCEFICMCGLL